MYPKAKYQWIRHIRTVAAAAALALCTMAAVAVNPQYEKFKKLRYRDNCDNFQPGRFQSITGCFDGKTTDTLTLFPFDGFRNGEGDGALFYYDKWIVISKNGTVPSTVIESYYPRLVMEGDLDGNGRDEFGVLLTGMNSNWCTYRAYTLNNKKVATFTEITWYDGGDYNLSSAMKRGKRRGEVIILDAVWNDATEWYDFKYKTRRITEFMKQAR